MYTSNFRTFFNERNFTCEFLCQNVNIFILFLGELNTHNEKILMIHGGLGGHIDNRFLGQKGKGNHVKLVLKLIADIGLVG